MKNTKFDKSSPHASEVSKQMPYRRNRFPDPTFRSLI